MKLKSLNAVPAAFRPLLKLALSALGGAEACGDEAGLRHHGAEAIRAAVLDLSGGDDAPNGRGAEGRLQTALEAHASARRALAEAMAEARAYCATALDVLRSRYGRKWNRRWAEAGFSWGTLEVPREPVAMLTDLRGWFREHPETENAGLNVSAQRCSGMLEALVTAKLQAAAGRAAEMAARRERNAAQRRLQQRMSGLRQELSMLLGPEDERWYRFGFRRPADGRIPGEVKGLRAEAGLPGEVRVEWEGAARAVNYRVTVLAQGEAEAADVTEAAGKADAGNAADAVDAGLAAERKPENVADVAEAEVATERKPEKARKAEPEGAEAGAAVGETEPEVLQTGLYADRTASVRGLPEGARVLVRVSARNASGESAPVQMEVTLARSAPPSSLSS